MQTRKLILSGTLATFLLNGVASAQTARVRRHPDQSHSVGTARAVTAMVRRIASLRLLEPELDAHCQAVKAAGFAWGQRAGSV